MENQRKQAIKQLDMNIEITFAELSRYIKEHYDKSLNFSRTTDKEVCVSYEQNIIFRTVQIPVSLSIDEVRDDAVSITYNGGFGIDMMIAGALSFMKAKLPELSNVLVAREGHQLRIELSQLSQTKAIVENVRLRDILIHEDRFEVKVNLK